MYVAAALAITAAAACPAQPAVEAASERVIALKQTTDTADIQALATLVRSIADIRQVSADTTRRTVAFRGSANQIAVAEWLVAELDRPAPGQPREFRFGGDDPVIRVFYLRHAVTTEDVQEVATVIRSAGNIRRAFVYNTLKALTLRGTAEQMAFAEWLINSLDHPARSQAAATPVYRVSMSSDDVARVFYIGPGQSAIDLQENTTLIRSLAEISLGFLCRAPQAIVVRGTAEQIAAANWLLVSIGAASTGVTEYPLVANAERIRLFWLPPTMSPESFQETLTSVRARSGMRRVFRLSARRILAGRGTAEEIAAAEQAIRDATAK
jgi:hypothetical protein